MRAARAARGDRERPGRAGRRAAGGSEATASCWPGSPRRQPLARQTRSWRGSLRPPTGCATPGSRLGFHNHDGELRPLDDGRTVLDRLVELREEQLFLEVDLGWAWFAGVDPASLVAAAGAARAARARQGPRPRAEPRYVPVGDGDVGYASVLPAIRELGVEWLLVEQDEAEGSALDAVRRSFAAVTDMVGSPA